MKTSSLAERLSIYSFKSLTYILLDFVFTVFSKVNFFNRYFLALFSKPICQDKEIITSPFYKT
jgi:hypothetical protein